MYNFENYIFHPLLSLLSGLVLLISISCLGFFFINIFLRKTTLNNYSFFLNSPLIGSNLIIFFLVPIIYFELHSLIFFRILSLSLLLFSIFILYKNYKILNKIKFYKKYIFLYFILLLIFFLCIAPVTHADSLAYHMLGGVNFLIKGSLLKDLLPLEIKLAGPGEFLIALGLSVGSEQFGTLVQYSSISSIIYIFLNINKKNNKISIILLLGIITTPTFLFLVSSPKPQLMQIVNVLFSSFLVYKIYQNTLSKKITNNFVYLIIFLLTLNILVKYSFLLSSLLVIFVLSLILFRHKKIQILFYPILLVIIFLVFPKYVFYYKYFDTNIFYFLKSHLPTNLLLYNDIHVALKSIADGNRFFPTWLIFPKNLGYGGTIIGPMILSFFLFSFNKKKINLLVFSFLILFLIIVLVYGQATSRFIFEGFIIAQLFLIINNIRNVICFKILKYYVYFQSSIAVILLIYLISNLTPGVLSKTARLKVMNNNANGYELMNWINTNLSENEQILTSHRSIGLLNNKSYSLIFLNYLNKNDKNFDNYLNFLRENEVKKVFLFDGFSLNKFEGCLKKKILTKKNTPITFGRNPFKDKIRRDSHLYELDLDNLETCIK